MKFRLWGAATALALAACAGDEAPVNPDADSDGKMTATEVRDALLSNEDIKPEAGLYQTSMTLTKVEMPGAPAEMADMMRQAMNQSSEVCLTPEQAERGFKDTIQESQSEACTIDSYDLDGGKIAMTMTCDEEGLGLMNVEMSGEVSATSSNLNMQMKGATAATQDLEIEMNFQQKRIGECNS